MRFHSMNVSLIALCLGTLVVQIFGKLIIIRQRSPWEDQSLICETDNLRAGLLWNYDLQNSHESTNDSSAISIPSTLECGRIEPNGCENAWKIHEGWAVVDSIDKPMGPAFDYRLNVLEDLDSMSQYVRGVSEKGAIVFSAQGFGDINIKLCENNTISENSCRSITIPAQPNKTFVINPCVDEEREAEIQPSCEIEQGEDERSAIVADEWRTFTLTWDTTLVKIRAHEGTGFSLEKRLIEPKNIASLSVQGFDTGRIRFHSYKYLWSETSNTTLYSNQFSSRRGKSCYQMLISLCQKCELSVRIVNSKNNNKGGVFNFSGTGFSHDELPMWQNVELPRVSYYNQNQKFTFEITTISHEDNVQGWWAVDNLRECKSYIQTTGFGMERGIIPSATPIGCQELSYNKTATVKADNAITDNIRSNLTECDTGRLGLNCQHECTWPCVGTSICDETGCFCPPGLEGADCDTICPNGYYGYNCQHFCRCGKFEICNNANGHCTGTCVEHSLPPSCERRLEAPTVVRVTATEALLHYTEITAEEISAVILHIEIKGWYDWPYSHLRVGYFGPETILLTKLTPMTLYKVKFEVSTQFGVVQSPEGIFETNPIPTKAPTIEITATQPPIHVINENSSTPNWSWLLLIPIVVLSTILYFLWRRSPSDNIWLEDRQDIVPFPQSILNFVKAATTCTAQQQPRFNYDDELSDMSGPPEVFLWNRYSHSVNIDEFENYVKESSSSDVLKKQFRMLPRGATRSCKHGSLPENAPKNRYIDILPYDHSRVVLTKTSDDPHSDYINANYVQGFRNKKAYIATQGPKPQTVTDFWKMVWQEEVRVICMIANITESHRIKCEQYWPEFGETGTYGEIVVTTTNYDVFADYTFRTFRVTWKEESRKVQQLHFTEWPDHAVPAYSLSVINYLRKLQSIPTGDTPIIMHCSAGIGRTGAIILSDICMRQAKTKGTIDVLATLKKIRNCRMNMVDNYLQYLFVHLLLTDYVVIRPTEIQYNSNLSQALEEQKKKIPKHIERLRNSQWQNQLLRCQWSSGPLLQDHIAKNRFPELTPVGSELVILQRFPPHERNSEYISAVRVDGPRIKKQYLASQLPMPETLSDFWRLIVEQRVHLVVILQKPDSKDPTCCDIIPSGKSFSPVPFINVRPRTNVSPGKSLRTDELLVTDTSRAIPRTHKLTILTCREWGLGKGGKTPPAKNLIELWLASRNIDRENQPTLVLCHDGVTGTGLYLALSFILERMNTDLVCDVIYAVRSLRRSRSDFVQSQEQFEYLYNAAAHYIEFFETHSHLP